MIRSDAPYLVVHCVPKREVAGQKLPRGPGKDDPAQSVAGDAVRLAIGSSPQGLGGRHRIDWTDPILARMA